MEPTTTPETPKSNLMIPVAIIIAGLMVSGALIFNGLGTKAPADALAGLTPDAPINIAPVTENDHILGNPKATLFVVEYSDMECPFCKQYHATLKQMMSEFGADGKVAWVYRHFPLYKGTETNPPLHSKAGKEAEATECANELGGASAFWKYIDRIYEITPANNGFDLAKLPEVAVYAGLDKAKFEACLSSGKYASKVEASYQEGLAAGAQGTPYTVIIDSRDGKPYPVDAGAIPYPALSTLIKSVLNKK